MLTGLQNIPVVIPAFNPGPALAEFVQALAARHTGPIVIVDDGSAPEHQRHFDTVQQWPGVHILRHAVNLGKGAALKTGINHVLFSWPDALGIVTADADGQHHTGDVLKVAGLLRANPGTLVLGARRFDTQVPFRSRAGNLVTRLLVTILVGKRLTDTQTGLRGIPRPLLAHLMRIVSSGYDFELDMLIAAKHHSTAILETPIQTLYIDQNRGSHFNPIFDSIRIYFVLFRFSVLSLLTALVDNAAFYVVFGWTGTVLGSQVTARLLALVFNYQAARRAVFISQERHRVTFPKYLALVAASGAVSYGLITFLTTQFLLNVFAAKLLAEGLLFIANFAIQRDFVFTRRREPEEATNWTRYYQQVPFTARLTRQYTAGILASVFRRFTDRGQQIVELGGANSCFLDRIVRDAEPAVYHVIDNNPYGLDLLRNRLLQPHPVVIWQQDITQLKLDVQADVVFSVGLIEHFDPPQTREAIHAHFDLLKAGGCAIISFPTPTLLYRVARSICEALGVWKFPDERPLRREEVVEAATKCGELVYEKILWPLVFTQCLIVVRKAA